MCSQFLSVEQYGEEDEFNLTIFQSYVDEIYAFISNVAHSTQDYLETVMFWRGVTPIGPFLVPTHSVVIYTMGNLLIENPCYSPAVFFFSIGFLLLGGMEKRLLHPSPWIKCNNFLFYFWVLTFGRPFPKRKQIFIEKNANKDEIEEYEQNMDDMVKNEEEAYRREIELREKIKKDLGSTEVTTGNSSVRKNMKIIKSLTRLQVMLGGKFVKSNSFYSAV